MYTYIINQQKTKNDNQTGHIWLIPNLNSDISVVTCVK